MRAEIQTAGALRAPNLRLRALTAQIREYAPALAALVGALAFWQLATARLHLVASYLLPAPTDIAATMHAHVGYLLGQTWVTAREIVLGYLAGTALGIAFALMIFYSRLLRRIVYPFVLTSQYLPKLAVAPLIIVWFGLDVWPKVLVTALICLFPIMVNTLAGLRDSDPCALELLHVLHASRRQTFLMIQLPAACPQIFAGLKVGITLATTGAVVAEWISADAGLGYLITFSLGDFQITMLYAALVMLACLGIALFGLVVLAEHLLMPHQPSAQMAEHTL
jgi:NitT/TauT family transport system permease protein